MVYSNFVDKLDWRTNRTLNKKMRVFLAISKYGSGKGIFELLVLEGEWSREKVHMLLVLICFWEQYKKCERENEERFFFL